MPVRPSQGAVLLSESKDGRTVPAALPGQEKATIQEAFLSPKDEYLFGSGQFQDGFLTIRDLPRRLTQVNTQISIPFLLSSKGYGLLWHNFGRTDLNPADNLVTLQKTGTGQATSDEVTTASGSEKEVRQEAFFSGEFEVEQAGPQAMMLDVGHHRLHRVRPPLER